MGPSSPAKGPSSPAAGGRVLRLMGPSSPSDGAEFSGGRLLRGAEFSGAEFSGYHPVHYVYTLLKMGV